MNRSEFAGLLASEGIKVDNLDQYLNDLQLGDDIPQAMVKSMIAELRSQSTAIAPTPPTAQPPVGGAVIAPLPAKRSNKLTKAELQRQLEAAQAQLAQQQTPVQQVKAHIPTAKQGADFVLQNIQTYVAGTEATIEQGANAIARYNASLPTRFWQAVEVQSTAIGVFDTTDSIVAQQQTNAENLLDSIQQIFDEGDRALGISSVLTEAK